MEPKKKGRRFIPKFIPLDKDIIKIVNDFDGDKHMRAIRKPGDDKVYLYVSPLFYIAIMDFKRGRYSQTTYAKKSEFTKFMDNKIPAQTRSHIKKYIQPRTKSIMGMDMHLVDLPHMTDKGGHYEMPFGAERPEGESLSTALFENKNTLKISELRTIIKEEIANKLSEISGDAEFASSAGEHYVDGTPDQPSQGDQIKADFIEKLAIEFNDTIKNWKYSLQDFDFDEAADVILMNADLPQGMSVDMKNDITTDDIITRATAIEFGMDEIVKEEIDIDSIETIDFDTADVDTKINNIETYLSEKQQTAFFKIIWALGKEKTTHVLDTILNDLRLGDPATWSEEDKVNFIDLLDDAHMGTINESEESTKITNLEKFAIALKKSIDSNDRFTIRLIPPMRLDGKMYYGIEKDDPERFNQFKYGSYAVEEPWGIIANMLGLDFEGEEYGRDTHDTINKLMKSLRAKKLIDLEW